MLIGSKMADSMTTSRRVRADLRSGATHDAGDADRTLRVGDDQRLRRELAVDVVERLESLGVARETDDDAAGVHRGRVERMDRLAELEHHVIADVDDVADRALPGRQRAASGRGPVRV